jgi:hypothetical protein
LRNILITGQTGLAKALAHVYSAHNVTCVSKSSGHNINCVKEWGINFVDYDSVFNCAYDETGQQLVLEYFKNFTDKNLDALGDMFSDNVKLTDWNVQANGRQQVLQENKSIFDTTGQINILVSNMAQNDNVVFSEIQVVIDDTTFIKVVDIIFFDTHNKITEIKAYKQ